MGPSGSGKSSLLAFAAGFLDPVFKAQGNIYLDGKNITGLPANKRRIGLMFQDALLFPHMSVGENLAFALIRKKGQSRSDRQAIVEQALVDADMAGLADRDPATLSGGQRSRIALMRVLLAEPGALLLDEPFSKLDTQLRNQIREFVFAEAKKRNLPVLLVTHDLEDAEAAGGRTVVLTETDCEQ
ncbi:unnamed protein product [Cyprideis torosa]|uniref:Uncharacterized protein n=1 Tax=Cyprideis torosa TaxID=163714 RepID=A0A7R8ZW99_9CRUS|nr:unnamed protein product [Cyprideis torosa]CAG0911491.1 unnamed protein product [Cyprideis torosa]